jgi:hypothetical protein
MELNIRESRLFISVPEATRFEEGGGDRTRLEKQILEASPGGAGARATRS